MRPDCRAYGLTPHTIGGAFAHTDTQKPEWRARSAQACVLRQGLQGRPTRAAPWGGSLPRLTGRFSMAAKANPAGLAVFALALPLDAAAGGLTQTRSTISAMPWPTPMHMVHRP